MTFRYSLLLHRAASAAADVLAGLSAWVLAIYLRYGHLGLPQPELFHVAPEWVLFPYFVAVLGLFQLSGAYRTDRLSVLRVDLGLVARALPILAIVVYASVAVFKLQEVSRLCLGYVLVIQGLLSVALRLLLSRAFAARFRANPLRMLLVGSGAEAQGFVRRVACHPEFGLSLVGWVTEEVAPTAKGLAPAPPASGGVSVLGHIRDLPRILRDEVVHEVVVATSEATAGRVIAACYREGKPVHLLLGSLRGGFGYCTLTSVQGLSVLSLTGPAHNLGALLAKRVFDLFGAAVGLIALSPLLIVVAILIRLSSPGPALFRQERVGQSGRCFGIVKFRTMVEDAEDLKADLLPLNEAEGPAFKIKDDPRITPVGRFLRRTNLDELPQLLNVLRGEMSLVGPRPLPTSEARECYEWYKRHSVKPGMTGLWQVSGRHNLSFDEWMRLDLAYVDNWSLWGDLRILLRTVPEVVGLRGV